ncbi:hypothetical protein LSAT2_021491 [Lamellibrachia satsuma]|nr:hypothetical protein LSAT2_021491 [Lamellibrachia satsuma]
MEWDACSTSCGDGRQGRKRTCEGPYYGGAKCVGALDQERDCFLVECPIDGVWTAWTEWGDCSVTCADGVHYRTRTCDGPYYAGLDCPGLAIDDEACFDRYCPGVTIPVIFIMLSLSWASSPRHRRDVVVVPGVTIPVIFIMLSLCPGRHRPVLPFLFLESKPPLLSLSSTSSPPCHRHDVVVVIGVIAPVIVMMLSLSSALSLRHRHDVVVVLGVIAPVIVMMLSLSSASSPPSSSLQWTGSGRRGASGASVTSHVAEEYVIAAESVRSRCMAAPTVPVRRAAQRSAIQTFARSRETGCRGLRGVFAQSRVAGASGSGLECVTWTPQSCTDLVNRGLRDNASIIEIDPDNGSKQKPFWVYCDVNSDNSTGVTVIHHNFEKDTLVKGYEGPGEYVGKLVYRDPFDKVITIMQLRNLVDVSDHCRQHIMWNCSSTAFNPPEEGRSYRLTYWSNRDDVEMTYWGGAKVRGYYEEHMRCACGDTDSCDKPKLRCNCDINDAQWRLDEGDLTFKPDLPVSAFHAGDTGDDVEKEQGSFAVGALYCSGTGISDYYDDFFG